MYSPLLKSSTIFLTLPVAVGGLLVVAPGIRFPTATLDRRQLVRERVQSAADLHDPVICQKKAGFWWFQCMYL